MNRALRFTLLGFAVVIAAAGCSGEEKPLMLEEWASRVCIAFDSYVTEEVKSTKDELSSIWSAAFGIDNPDDYVIDFKNPPPLRKDAPELIPKELLLEQIENLQAADRGIIEKLESVGQPPDTEAGRLGGKLLADEMKRIRENLDYLGEDETQLQTYSPADSTPREAIVALGQVIAAAGYPYGQAFFFANTVGLLAGAKPRMGAELAQAFKDADGCRSWTKDIAAGEHQGERLTP